MQQQTHLQSPRRNDTATTERDNEESSSSFAPQWGRNNEDNEKESLRLWDQENKPKEDTTKYHHGKCHLCQTPLAIAIELDTQTKETTSSAMPPLLTFLM